MAATTLEVIFSLNFPDHTKVKMHNPKVFVNYVHISQDQFEGGDWDLP